MSKSRTGTKIVLILVGGLALLVCLGIWMGTTRLHPNPQDIPSVTSAAPPPEWTGAVAQGRQIVRTTLSENNLPGLSVAVGIGSEIVWAEGFGFANLMTSTPVTPDHRFRIGSASPVLTAAAAGVLLADGRLKLDDEIQTYVPAFPKKQWPVTLRQLMGHTAGLTSDSGDQGPLFTKHCGRPIEALQYFAENPLLFQPGTQYRYSDFDWILVSAAIEAATKQPFLSFIREQVSGPLGMRNTVPDGATLDGEDFPPFTLVRERVFDPSARRGEAKNPSQDRVIFYFPRFAADPNYGMHEMRLLDYSCYAGAGVFMSTPSDLVRYGMAIQSGKQLTPATVQQLQTPQRLAAGQETGYGLGWELRTVTLAGKPARMAGHDGGSFGGKVVSLMTFPEYGLVVAVASNISHTDTYSLAERIAQAFAASGRIPVLKGSIQH